MNKALFVVLSLLCYDVLAQCPQGTVFFYGHCCLPNYSACVNIYTGEFISVPSGGGYGGYLGGGYGGYLMPTPSLPYGPSNTNPLGHPAFSDDPDVVDRWVKKWALD